VIVRPMRPEDVEEVKAIHAQMGIDYVFPVELDFAEVIEHDGQIIGAGGCRTIAETYMWIRPDLDPRDKWTAIRLGQQGMLKWARENGVRELIAAICSNVVNKFTKRLQMLKWESHRDGWALWSRRVS